MSEMKTETDINENLLGCEKNESAKINNQVKKPSLVSSSSSFQLIELSEREHVGMAIGNVSTTKSRSLY
jgi:hypothetical protein